MAKKPSPKSPDSKASAAPGKKAVVALTHEDAKRKNIPTAELESVMAKAAHSPIRVAYERRNRDLDPQLVWRGKDDQDWSDLVVPAPPLFIQEKVHPKALIDDLRRQTDAAELAKKLATGKHRHVEEQIDLFADFNGLPNTDAKTEFYQHDAHWANRMILGDSLQVMASLAEREGLRGQVQCIYFDPPYGIKFNSNFQWSTTSRDVKDGKSDHITREPEQVKAFRDTWRDGIHSYLTYLRDRLTVARDLLSQSGSLFVQIGDENVHRVRALMDEVFGDHNCIAVIPFVKTSSSFSARLDQVNDYVLWYGRDAAATKYRQLYTVDEEPNTYSFPAIDERDGTWRRLSANEVVAKSDMTRLFRTANLTSQSPATTTAFDYRFQGVSYKRSNNTYWKTNLQGMERLRYAGRLVAVGKTMTYKRYQADFPAKAVNNWWDDTIQSTFATQNIYVVQTYTKIVQRCILMATDPGDLVLDPTCGSGTTAFVSEQWGRRWITIDTSRVALALARGRLMGARYPYYLLADSVEGRSQEAMVSGKAPPSAKPLGTIRQGFVYERLRHVSLRTISTSATIDAIVESWRAKTDSLLAAVASQAGRPLLEEDFPANDPPEWSDDAKKASAAFRAAILERTAEVSRSVLATAEFEQLYDKPCEDKKKVRVAGPFTVESLSPHRTLGVDENDELIDPLAPKDNAGDEAAGAQQDFAAMVLETLKVAGVQQADRKDRITFSSLSPWPGRYICAEGRYAEGDGGTHTKEKRAAIFIGPEFGTVSRQDLVVAAREAGDADFDVLIACAFNYEAHASEFNKLGRIPVLKARINAELHMGSQLKNTGKGNLFVIFGEPDIEILPPEDAPKGAKVKDFTFIRVKINGVDVFHPQTGEVRSDGAEGIACWFIDTDYNEESFFVRQAYFLGANDPYKALKTTLKAEINEEAWATLRSDTSRTFEKPKGGKIAVKVINHLGDEVMKVFRVE